MQGNAAVPLMPKSALACQSLEFMPIWDKIVKPGCQRILQNPLDASDVTTLFSAVYRLASNPCTKVPVLIRGSQNERVETRDMTAQQCLVLYYLLRELLKEHLEKRVLHADGPLKSALAQAEDAANTSAFAGLACVYVEEWYKMSESLRRLKAVFNYLQNHWHTLHMQNTNIFFNVTSMGVNMWNEQVVIPNKSKLTAVMMHLYFEDTVDGIPEAYAADASGVCTPAQLVLRDMTSALLDLDQHVSHSVFDSLYRQPVLKSLKIRYEKDADSYFDDAKPLYASLREIREAILTEGARTEKCTADQATVVTVKTIVLEQLLAKGDRLKKCLADAMNVWLTGTEEQQPNSDALSLLHKLLQPSPQSLAALAEALTERISTHGKQLITKAIVLNSPGIDMSIVEVVVNFCCQVDTVAREAFGDDSAMASAFEKGVSDLVNNNGTWDRFTGDISPLARYIHQLIVSGRVAIAQQSDTSPNTSAAHAIPTLDPRTQMAVYLFKLLRGAKDSFFSQYHRDLSRRLLYFDGVDFSVERALVAKIGVMSPSPEQVHSYTKMIDERSGKVGRDAVDWSGSGDSASSLSHLRLIALAHYWPWGGKNPPHLHWPKPIPGHRDGLLSFFHSKSGAGVPSTFGLLKGQRRIVAQWIPGISFVQLQTNPKHFPNTRRHVDITVSHLQCMILLAFQDASKGRLMFSAITSPLTREDGTSEKGSRDKPYPYLKSDVAFAVVALFRSGLLRSDAEVTEENLMRSDIPLDIDASFSPGGAKNIGNVDAVDLFTDGMLFPQTERDAVLDGVKGVLQGSPSGQGSSKTASAKCPSTVNKPSLLQAHIVRIVKSQSSISHSDLISRLGQDLSRHFEVKPEDAKVEIEKLLDKDFIERDPNAQGAYRYVA